MGKHNIILKINLSETSDAKTRQLKKIEIKRKLKKTI